jgi:hypothetical protein
MKRFGKQEAIYRTKGLIKDQVGSAVVPLDLHDLLCEQENDPKLVKLHLIMLLAFEYVNYGRAACVGVRRTASGYACGHTACVRLCTHTWLATDACACTHGARACCVPGVAMRCVCGTWCGHSWCAPYTIAWRQLHGPGTVRASGLDFYQRRAGGSGGSGGSGGAGQSICSARASRSSAARPQQLANGVR